jgi:hypothetical protein
LAAVRFKNFHIWKRKLPHWRADDVTYFVTFRHARPLEQTERSLLLDALLKAAGRKLEYLAIGVRPDRSELLFRVLDDSSGKPYELSKVVEAAKRKAGAKLIKGTSERFPPFWNESYDRIVRDDAELEERWEAIVAEEDETGHALWVRGL